jgi:6-phosphofructokinase 1
MLRSGPRQVLHFDASEEGACAAIVTCGGICPGLNSVIRELVMMLDNYGVKKVYGIIGGYKGCVQPESWIQLTPDGVKEIHETGGSVLVSDRGNPAHCDIAKSLATMNVRQYFVLGGDGTHQGAFDSFTEMQKIGHECAVVGVPKTIDNDIPLLDRSFGFNTACTEAEKAIDSAYVESSTNANCIGLVKLMGRHCGFIAAESTLAARHVDICLIPEMQIDKDKLLSYVESVMRRQQRAVIVVAEGCGDTLIQSGDQVDAGGNQVLADVGPWLKDEITKYLKSKQVPITVKYIDPTYMIRSVPANACDSRYCAVLAHQAVHAAMAGYTGITVGKVDERYVMLPIHAITGTGGRKLDTKGVMYERLLATTHQPSFK